MCAGTRTPTARSSGSSSACTRAHIVTDVGDTLVLTVLMFTRHGHGKRFADVEDNAFYWNFVVLSWLPIYALIYWAPRL